MTKFRLRKTIQIVFIGIWILLILILIPQKFGTCHQFCPYAVICFGMMMPSGYAAYIPTLIVGIFIALSTIFWGRLFCGYVCLLGTIQENIFKLRKNKKKYNQIISYKYHRFLILLKYFILILTLIFALLTIQYFYMAYCPVVAISHLTIMGIGAAVFFLIILLLSLFVERFWCRYLCPYAALMNIFQYLGKALKIKRVMIFRNVETSINCFNCTNYCPMSIDIGYNEEIADSDCIHCYRCVRLCSKKDAARSKCIYRDFV